MTTRTTNSIKPLPARVDPAGHRCGAFEARRGDEALRVYERIYNSADKESWSDVSTWYWQAMIGKTSGGWWAVTVFVQARLRCADAVSAAFSRFSWLLGRFFRIVWSPAYSALLIRAGAGFDNLNRLDQ